MSLYRLAHSLGGARSWQPKAGSTRASLEEMLVSVLLVAMAAEVQEL